MRTKRVRTTRGFFLITGLLAVSGLLALCAIGMTRSLTDLQAARLSGEQSQAFQLAEASIDRAMEILRADESSMGENYYRGRAINDPDNPNGPLIEWPAGNGLFTHEIVRIGRRLNTMSERGVDANRQFGMANEDIFEITATGISATGQRRTIRAVVARGQAPWVGGASDNPIYIRRHRLNDNGIYLYNVAEDDLTEITGDLRTNWNVTRDYDNDLDDDGTPDAYAYPTGPHNPITVPAGTVITGETSTLVTPDSPPAGWQQYFFAASFGAPTGNSGSNRDAIWIGPAAPINPTDPVSAMLPDASVASLNTMEETQRIAPNTAQLTPATGVVDSAGNNCDDPPHFVFGDNDQDTRHATPVLPAGTYCYASYTVGQSDTVMYDGPTVIYVTGSADNANNLGSGGVSELSDAQTILQGRAASGGDSNVHAADNAMMLFLERSNVGMPADLANPAQSGDPLPGTADFANGKVQFRSAGARDTRLRCLSHVHGSIIAPDSQLIIQHVGPFNDPRGIAVGSFFVGSLEVRPGANLAFLGDGGSAEPWIRLVSWDEVLPTDP